MVRFSVETGVSLLRVQTVCQGVKRPWLEANHSPPSSAEVDFEISGFGCGH
jgi:hypothetical protein